MKVFNETKSTKYILLTFVLFVCLNCGCTNRNDTTVNGYDTITECHDSCVVITPKIINLGIINKDAYPRHELKYELKNRSDSIVRINKIDVSCGCVSIVSYPDSILPNHTEIIAAEIDLSNQNGHLRKIIFVNYNDRQVRMAKVVADIKD